MYEHTYVKMPIYADKQIANLTNLLLYALVLTKLIFDFCAVHLWLVLNLTVNQNINKAYRIFNYRETISWLK